MKLKAFLIRVVIKITWLFFIKVVMKISWLLLIILYKIYVRVFPTYIQKNIAHNDIKPDNVMCDFSTGKIKFIDFGLSCKSDSCTIKAGSDLSGTLDYIDLYQYRKNLNRQEITPMERMSGDIWAFGIIVYEMIVGKVPIMFYGNDDPDIIRYSNKYSYKIDLYAVPIQKVLNRLKHPFNLNLLLTDEPKNRKLPC